ncbi:hypothetical protein FRC00_012684 [Tulasnella sp. 408]|nr:hypothetical protein FRC00_012684 [Tulasnella sp. 408]
MDKDILMEDENHHLGADVAGLLGSAPSGSSAGFEPSNKLRARIEKLAHWRIKLSSIGLDENRAGSHGAHAAVLRGTIAIRETERRDLRKRASGKNIAIDDFIKKREAMTGWLGKLDVAVKKMRVADDMDFERVLGLAIREAEFLANLNHRNIVELEGFVEDVSKSIIWLVSPWAFNGNLKDFIAGEDWEIPERISLIDDVAQGLAYLHSREPPICHGDLKSVYADLDEYGYAQIYARITDFGSARRLTQRDSNTQMGKVEGQSRPLNVIFNPSTNTITLTGNKYTLRWAAPELLIEDPMFVPEKDGQEKTFLSPERRRDLGDMYQSRGEYAKAFAFFAEALKASEQWRDTEEMFAALRGVAQLGRLQKQYSEAIALYDVIWHSYSRRDFWGEGNFDDMASALCDLAELHQLRNEGDRTIERLCKDEGVQGQQRIAEGLCEIAAHHLSRDRHVKASLIFTKAMEISANLGDRKGEADALWGLAEVHRLRGEYDDAIRLYNEVLEISTDLGHGEGQFNALRGLSEVHRHRGVYDDAIPLYDTLWCLAQVHRLRGEYDDAIRLYNEALEISTSVGHRKGRADALWGLAEGRRLRNEHNEAISLYYRALQISTAIFDRQGQVAALLGLAKVYSE